jgi:hypothetical protein
LILKQIYQKVFKNLKKKEILGVLPENQEIYLQDQMLVDDQINFGEIKKLEKGVDNEIKLFLEFKKINLNIKTFDGMLISIKDILPFEKTSLIFNKLKTKYISNFELIFESKSISELDLISDYLIKNNSLLLLRKKK